MGKRIQQVRLTDLKNEILYLGYVGENIHTQIVINCTEVFNDYPDAVASIVVKPPRGDIYLATISRNEDYLIWEVTRSDVAEAGNGKVQLSFVNDGEVIRSVIANTKIDASIEATGEAPAPIQNWIEQAEETAAQIAQGAARQAAVDVVEEAEAEIERVAGTIPADYSALSDQVSHQSDEIGDLKSAFDSIETATNDIPKTRDSDATGIDLDISDTNGNVLVRFSNGHIKTKNFNSANAFPFPAPIDSDVDLAISDVNGNALVLFKNGQIQTKKFDSKYIRQLTGKKWACLGDSLTEHNQRTTMNYHDYIAQETGITVFNLGHSGCGYAKTGGNGQKFVDQAENIPNDTDVITIFGSGNDSSSGLEIGNPTDSGTTTICGYINAAIDTIYASHPVTPLGVIIPTPWANKEPSDGQTWMKDYSEAIIAICTLRGIPYLDLWHCSNLHPSDVNFRPLAYSKDDGNGVHPDETGHALIAPRIRQFLFSLI